MLRQGGILWGPGAEFVLPSPMTSPYFEFLICQRGPVSLQLPADHSAKTAGEVSEDEL